MSVELESIPALLHDHFSSSLASDKDGCNEGSSFSPDSYSCDGVYTLDEIAQLIGSSRAYLPSRMSALFSAREIGGEGAVEALVGGLHDKSVLLKHEIAYVLGQLGCPAALDTLRNLLDDTQENEMVRHEAAEALAAIGDQTSIETLSRHISSETSPPVRETCILAKLSLERQRSNQENKEKENKEEKKNENEEKEEEKNEEEIKSIYKTVDPFEGIKKLTEKNQILKIRDNLFDENAPIENRYEALFTLRNINDDFAVENVNKVLVSDKGSVLFRHEVAFVLGQMQNLRSADSLIQCLNNKEEHSMVRHEAALSVGSIAVHAIFLFNEENEKKNKNENKKEDQNESKNKFHNFSEQQTSFINRCINALKGNLNDEDRVVSESCLVALQNILDDCNLKHF